MNRSQVCMIETRDIIFDHNELYYTFHVLNMKIILNTTLPKMYLLYLYHISLQNWTNNYQECQQLSVVINYVGGIVGERSFSSCNLYYYLSQQSFF